MTTDYERALAALELCYKCSEGGVILGFNNYNIIKSALQAADKREQMERDMRKLNNVRENGDE